MFEILSHTLVCLLTTLFDERLLKVLQDPQFLIRLVFGILPHFGLSVPLIAKFRQTLLPIVKVVLLFVVKGFDVLFNVVDFILRLGVTSRVQALSRGYFPESSDHGFLRFNYLPKLHVSRLEFNAHELDLILREGHNGIQNHVFLLIIAAKGEVQGFSLELSLEQISILHFYTAIRLL